MKIIMVSSHNLDWGRLLECIAHLSQEEKADVVALCVDQRTCSPTDLLDDAFGSRFYVIKEDNNNEWIAWISNKIGAIAKDCNDQIAFFIHDNFARGKEHLEHGDTLFFRVRQQLIQHNIDARHILLMAFYHEHNDEWWPWLAKFVDEVVGHTKIQERACKGSFEDTFHSFRELTNLIKKKTTIAEIHSLRCRLLTPLVALDLIQQANSIDNGKRESFKSEIKLTVQQAAFDIEYSMLCQHLFGKDDWEGFSKNIEMVKQECLIDRAALESFAIALEDKIAQLEV